MVKRKLIFSHGLVLFSICLLIFACNRYPPDVKRSLAAAGSNRHELEAVLEHYRNDPNSDKYRAACFLIGNMWGKKSLDTMSVTANQPFFDAIIRHRKLGEDVFNKFSAICDSVAETMSNYKPPKATFSLDLKKLTASFLIEHIDRCFAIKQNVPWGDSIEFDLFCRYLLPYSVGESFWEKSRSYWQKQYLHLADSLSDMMAVGKQIDREIQASFTHGGAFFEGDYAFLRPQSFRNMAFTRVGDCFQTCGLSIDALRALSIPATLNVIPWWGNSNSLHFLVEIISNKTPNVYDNKQHLYLKPDDELLSNMFWRMDVTNYSHDGIPEEVDIQTCRSIPKLYRICSTTQENCLACKADEKIPSFFKNDKLLDISAVYLKCAEVNITFNSKIDNHYVYLCCYNPEDFGMIPVAWAERQRETAVFSDMGVNVLYFPACFSNGNMVSVDAPFILQENGQKRYLECRTAQKDIVHLYSKVPYRLNLLKYAQDMLGARFQLANRRDLHDSTTIYRIEHPPYYTQEVKLSKPQTARYAVYNFSGLKRPMIAEMEFYGTDASGREVKLQGKPFGNPGIYDNPLANICDSNRLTFARADPTNLNGPSFFGIDFGKPCKITRFRYLPRNDDNAVVPGEVYELFYWNDGWQSLGKQMGHDDRTLVYTNVPANALLLLHNHTRGKESRPFTYENGTQIFW